MVNTMSVKCRKNNSLAGLRKVFISGIAKGGINPKVHRFGNLAGTSEEVGVK